MKKLFCIRSCSRDPKTFREQAEQAARLLPYGQVMLTVSDLHEKSRHDLPEAHSPWHEYTSYFSPIYKFFPHPTIEPFVPEKWTAKNRELLLAKQKILKELGLGAAFASVEPFYLPEPFFEAYPDLRGPRVDHPRRSSRPAYSMCVDREETLEIYKWMMAELKRNLPELGRFGFLMNDCGSGLCWIDRLYPGPNGPMHCQMRSSHDRLNDFLEALHEGAREGGGPIEITIGGNITNRQTLRHIPKLPPDTYHGGNRKAIHVGSMISACWPVLGLIDPIDVAVSMARCSDEAVRHIDLSVAMQYARAGESLETLTRLVDIVEDCVKEPARGHIQVTRKLEKICASLVGEKHAEELANAYRGIHDAMRMIAVTAPGRHLAVDNRFVVRPLLLKPKMLTPEEEAYFLPHIFNPDAESARDEYTNSHGSRLMGNPLLWSTAWLMIAPLQGALGALRGIAASLEKIEGSQNDALPKQLAMSLRLWVSMVRSCNNFYFGQVIRDRCRAVLAGEVAPSSPIGADAWSLDVRQWQEIARDELENSRELLALLEKGGLDQIAHADDPKNEDVFFLGPELKKGLQTKIALMQRHDNDAHRFLG
jgi:hypothetical protein